MVENGGIVNKLGTYTLAMVAKAFNTPFHVAVESYKFARLFPLNQRDLPNNRGHDKGQRRKLLLESLGVGDGQGVPLELQDSLEVPPPTLARALRPPDALPVRGFRRRPLAVTRRTSPVMQRSSTCDHGATGLWCLWPCAQVDNPCCDYTPPQYITLLSTDLGVFTPAAVSDELIKLYL